MVRHAVKGFAWWWGGGMALVLLVLYQSLASQPAIQTPGIAYGDKLGHFAAYFALTLWFAQLYQRRAHVQIMVLFIAMGVGVEFLQGLNPMRSFEVADMLANSIGAIAAWGLAATSFGTLLLRWQARA